MATSLNFCENFIYLNRRPISFASRPYLPAIYSVLHRNLVLRCSRQFEKSTFLVNTILYEACTRPGVKILFVSPRREQALVFSKLRLLASLEQSPLIRRALLKGRQRPQVMNLEFANGAALFIRAAYHSADACRGLSADLLLVDEFQDIAAGDLPVLQETLSHATHGRTILTGTPKSIENHLEGVFRASTAHEWLIRCPNCQKDVILDERCLGPVSVICPDCVIPLDPGAGRWVARNPQARWGEGFWVNHVMVPWLNFDDILERQQSYDICRYKNEVLGLPTTIGEHVVTRAELEACCREFPMAETLDQVPPQGRHNLVAGIDWGGGGVSQTVLVIGFMRSDYQFQVCRMERFTATEEPDRILDSIATRCRQFCIRLVAADGGGNGSVYNRMLVQRLGLSGGMYAIIYSSGRQPPWQDGLLWKWSIDRTASIGALFSRVKMQLILFPNLASSGSYLEDFACELADFDPENRIMKYFHPAGTNDDCLHATNYALTLAIFKHSVDQYHDG